ncbi:MAG: tetratricopeptide repeat protein [Candidatus Eisenbacteria bacterium]
MSNEIRNQAEENALTQSNDIERVFDEDGDEVLNENDCCSADDIEEAVKAFILGDITLAQLEGISAEEIYAVADMGYDLFEEGKIEEAKKIFEGLYTYNPMDPYFRTVLGSIYQRQSSFEEAAHHYTAAVELYPEDVTAWTNLGETQLQWAASLQQSGQADRAAEAFTGAVAALTQAVERTSNDALNESGLRARALINIAASIYESRQAN